MLATPCPRCRTPLPGDARFCTACGAEAVPVAAGVPAGHGFVPPDQGMAVCLGCGGIAPRQDSTCMICVLDLPPVQDRPAVPSDPAGRFWVAVRCQFQCRVCGHLSPLDHLDMDGSVVCLRCGMSQIFDVGSWNEGLEHAHAVGDLAGPHAEGRFPDREVSIAGINPFCDIGIGSSVAISQQSALVVEDGLMTTRSLRVEASPGQPLCRRCRACLQVTEASGHRLALACPACGDSHAYEIPPQATAACAGLRGVMADEHRLGSREARVEQGGGGAEVIRCPNCSAAVTVSGASTIVDCGYCHVSLRIPGNTLQRMGHHEPRPLVWWLLFEGPSARRRELADQVREAAREAKREQRRAQERRAAARERGAREPQPRAKAARDEPRPRAGGLSLIVPLVVVALVGHIGFREHVQRWIDGPAARSGAAAAGAGARGNGPEQGRAAAQGSERSAARQLQGCACTGRVGGERTRARLAVQVEEQPEERGEEQQAARDGTPVIELRYFLEVAGASHPLRAGEAGAQLARAAERRLGIGMGCHGDTVAIAAGDRVTGWSLVDGSMRWDVTLDAPYRYRGKPAEQGDPIECDRLRVRGGRVRVPMGRKQRTTIDMASGRVRR